MQITVTETNNSDKKIFKLPQEISNREKTYSEGKEALLSPVAHKLFGFPWTQEITVGRDFVAITKQDWVDWDVLEEPLLGLLKEHFANYNGATIEENPEPVKTESKSFASPEEQKIAELFENEINPSLASHGGFVTLQGIQDNKVYIKMGGGCQGCAMSYMTLKEGIETAIKSTVPTTSEVIDVTDHAQGTNPFYSK